MCLKVKENQKPLIAKKDIICYKLVEDKKRNGSLTTFYRHSPIVLGKMYESDIQIEHFRYFHYVSINQIDDYYEINKGLHSFIKLKTAIDTMLRYNACLSFIVKCIIPKGATYYKNIEKTEYASNKIIYTTEIMGTNKDILWN